MSILIPVLSADHYRDWRFGVYCGALKLRRWHATINLRNVEIEKLDRLRVLFSEA